VRNQIITLVILLSLGSSAQAQTISGFVEEMNVVSESGSTTPEFNLYVKGPIKGKFGWTSWGLITKEWSEATIGVTYAPADWIEVSWSAGVETNEKPLRHSPSIWVGKGKWSLLSVLEDGGSGYWYNYLGAYQVSGTVSAGVYSQKFVGTGPYISKSFGRFSLWGAYAVGDNRGIITARMKF